MRILRNEGLVLIVISVELMGFLALISVQNKHIQNKINYLYFKFHSALTVLQRRNKLTVYSSGMSKILGCLSKYSVYLMTKISKIQISYILYCCCFAFERYCHDHTGREKYLKGSYFGFCSLCFLLIKIASGPLWR